MAGRKRRSSNLVLRGTHPNTRIFLYRGCKLKVVIVGPRDKEELIYVQLVNDIIDNCSSRYSKVLFITKSCDQGVGKIIRGKCLDKHFKKPAFDMIEVSLRHYLINELPQSEFQSNFDSLNSTLLELGDEFHLIVEEPPRGSMSDLLLRIQKEGLPYVTYGPTELKAGAKQPEFQSKE